LIRYARRNLQTEGKAVSGIARGRRREEEGWKAEEPHRCKDHFVGRILRIDTRKRLLHSLNLSGISSAYGNNEFMGSGGHVYQRKARVSVAAPDPAVPH